MPVAGLFLGFAGECPRCNQQADFALLDENPQQTTDDIDEFIDLWIRYYDRMSEEDKALLPIIPVYFLKA